MSILPIGPISNRLGAASIALAVIACIGCRSAPPVSFDWPDKVNTTAGGWNYIRLPHLDRSIWFCTSSDECTWGHLGRAAGLAPVEYQWWARDIDGRPVVEAKPALGKRYTLPNRVYFAMGSASIYNPVAHVPYLGHAFQWIIDYPESAWSYATRPIGRAYSFRTAPPLAEGYKVTTLGNMGSKDLARILDSPHTYAFVYFGHGNKLGLSSKQTVHARLIPLMIIREKQHHLMGKVVLNSCIGLGVAEQMASPTGTAKGHKGSHQPPFGTLFW